MNQNQQGAQGFLPVFRAIDIHRKGLHFHGFHGHLRQIDIQEGIVAARKGRPKPKGIPIGYVPIDRHGINAIPVRPGRGLFLERGCFIRDYGRNALSFPDLLTHNQPEHVARQGYSPGNGKQSVFVDIEKTVHPGTQAGSYKNSVSGFCIGGDDIHLTGHKIDIFPIT
jgi:hypothetical protein